MLKVGFNAYLLANATVRGWSRYLINLLNALPDHDVRPVLYSNAPIHAEHLNRLPEGSFDVQISPSMRYLAFENWWIPRRLRVDNVDLFHCPMNYGLPFHTHCPRVLTLHDAIDQIYHEKRLGWPNKMRVSSIRTSLVNWIARRRADHIITVSKHAKQDIVDFLGISARKVSVIYEAADREFTRSPSVDSISMVKKAWDLSQDYFFYLGGWEDRKNIPFLVKAFAEASLSNVELVLAGGKDDQRSALLKLATSLGCSDRLRLLGYVPDSDLPALYSGALAFVYPSKYEGFGLQLVEAMAVGCPVLASNVTSLPEITSKGGETFSLESEFELINLLKKVYDDKSFRNELGQRAKLRGADFSWDRTAAETVSVYRELLKRNSRKSISIAQSQPTLGS